MHWIYLIHKFHNLSWITEINELFHDILIYWDAPVLFWPELLPVSCALDYIHGWMLKAQSVLLETVMSDETLGVCLCVRLCRGAWYTIKTCCIMTVELYKNQKWCRFKTSMESDKRRENYVSKQNMSYKINESIRVIFLVVSLPVDPLRDSSPKIQ